MDARTYVDTRVVGYELQRKRQQSAEGRLVAEARTDRNGRTRREPRLVRSAHARYVVAALIAALLAASFMGQLLTQEQRGDVLSWHIPEKRLVVQRHHTTSEQQVVTFRYVTHARAA